MAHIHASQRTAVWIADKAIYENPDVEITSFEMLQSVVDANEYLLAAAVHFNHDIEDHEFWNDVIDYFDEVIVKEMR